MKTHPCACGCGTLIPLKQKNSSPQKWVKGHHLKKYRGNQNGADKVEITKPCKNCGKAIHARRKEIGWAMKKKEFCNRKCSAVFHGKNCTHNLIPMMAASHTPTARVNRRLGYIEAQKRIPGLQKTPENYKAVWWRVRDYQGRIHEFKNLCWFIRENPSLFLKEDINYKHTIRSRAYSGISGLRPNPTRKIVNGSWKGWTWYSQTERLKNDGRDLIERKSHSHADLR